jgi:hypothetical protein
MTSSTAVQELMACIANLTYKSPDHVYAEFATEAGPNYEHNFQQAMVKTIIEQNKVILDIIAELHRIQRELDIKK